MSDVPQSFKYTETHEWVRQEEDGTVTMGITDHAQHLLGDLVFVELPEVGRTVTGSEEFAVVESVKAASDVYSPIAGEVVAVNDALEDEPELINKDAYADGWMVKLRPESSNPDDWEGLMDAEAYTQIAEKEDE